MLFAYLLSFVQSLFITVRQIELGQLFFQLLLGSSNLLKGSLQLHMAGALRQKGKINYFIIGVVIYDQAC